MYRTINKWINYQSLYWLRNYKKSNELVWILHCYGNLLVSFSDFQSEYLRCDCHLQWIVKWSRDKNVKIQQSTTCGVPKDLKGVPLKGLKKKDLHCGQYSHRVSFECSLSSIASTLGTQMVVDLSVSNIYSRESQTSIHEHITQIRTNDV